MTISVGELIWSDLTAPTAFSIDLNPSETFEGHYSVVRLALSIAMAFWIKVEH